MIRKTLNWPTSQRWMIKLKPLRTTDYRYECASKRVRVGTEQCYKWIERFKLEKKKKKERRKPLESTSYLLTLASNNRFFFFFFMVENTFASTNSLICSPFLACSKVRIWDKYFKVRRISDSQTSYFWWFLLVTNQDLVLAKQNSGHVLDSYP